MESRTGMGVGKVWVWVEVPREVGDCLAVDGRRVCFVGGVRWAGWQDEGWRRMNSVKRVDSYYWRVSS